MSMAMQQNLPDALLLCCCRVGFLVSIDKRQHAHDEATNTFAAVPEDFEFVFVQDNDAFFKSDEMNHLDEEIGDLDAFIKVSGVGRPVSVTMHRSNPLRLTLLPRGNCRTPKP